MRVLRSLRGQLALGAVLLTIIVVSLAGATIALRIDQRDRAALDADLSSRLTRVETDLPKMLDGGHNDQAGDDAYGDLLAGSDSVVRLIQNGTIIAARGADVSAPAPSSDGYSTITIAGTPWRSLTIAANDGSGTRLQALESLAPIQQRLTANTLLVVIVTLAAAILAGAGGWLLAVRILRPLERLQAGALALRTDYDTDLRLPVVAGPQEVADLTRTLDDLLDRLHTSARTARRFTADAGHELRTPLTSLGAYLELLGRDAQDSQHERLVAAARSEHHRLVSLLDGLQTLARGDAGAPPTREPVDLSETLDAAITHLRRQHPWTMIETITDHEETTVDGWPDGLQRTIENLLENAAQHGAANGHIRVTLARDDISILLIVDDDGPGIPTSERESILGRFVRGTTARSFGSGLGLALVSQQTKLHGGTLTLENSPLGGLRATVRFPTPDTE